MVIDIIADYLMRWMCISNIAISVVNFNTSFCCSYFLFKIKEIFANLTSLCKMLFTVLFYLQRILLIICVLLLFQVKVDPSLQVETKLNPYGRRLQMDKLRSRIVGGNVWQKRRLEDTYRCVVCRCMHGRQMFWVDCMCGWCRCNTFQLFHRLPVTVLMS